MLSRCFRQFCQLAKEPGLAVVTRVRSCAACALCAAQAQEWLRAEHCPWLPTPLCAPCGRKIQLEQERLFHGASAISQ
jgi:hypothetical protein